MGRKWLLQVLAGVTMSLGFAATPAVAQEIGTTDVVASESAGDPITVELPGGLGQVSVTPDPDAQTVTVEAAPVIEASEAETTLAPKVTAEVAPSGPAIDIGGPVAVAGNPLPIGSVTDPVEEAVGRPPASAPEAPAPVDRSRAATSTPVSSAPAPAAPAVAGPSEGRSSVPAGISRGRATATASATESALDDTLAPEIAPAAVNREAPQVMALPIVDTTPDVPALLRLMTGLMVLGAGLTWGSVRQHLQA